MIKIFKSLEKEEEDKFVTEAAKIGCAAIKFKRPGMRGAPDRIVFCPYAKTIFFEFKREDNEMSRQQNKFANGLIGIGFEVHCVYSCKEAMSILKDFAVHI